MKIYVTKSGSIWFWCQCCAPGLLVWTCVCVCCAGLEHSCQVQSLLEPWTIKVWRKIIVVVFKQEFIFWVTLFEMYCSIFNKSNKSSVVGDVIIVLTQMYYWCYYPPNFLKNCILLVVLTLMPCDFNMQCHCCLNFLTK